MSKICDVLRWIINFTLQINFLSSQIRFTRRISLCSFFTISILNAVNLQFVGSEAKGRISKRVFQENKARQIFRKTNISYPRIHTRTCAYQWVRNVCFSENLAHFVFLRHPFWDSHFCLITDEMTKNTKNTFTGEMHS